MACVFVCAGNVHSALWDIPHLEEGLEIIKKMDPNNSEAVKLIAGTYVCVCRGVSRGGRRGALAPPYTYLAPP